MKALSLLIAHILAVVSLFATGQFGDIIKYEGKERTLLSNPLEQYFEWSNSRPDFHILFPDGQSTACGRGYIAHWEISDGILYLTKIKSCHTDKEVALSLVVKDGQNDRIKADWFSGILRIPDGEQLKYVHAGYGSTYKKEILLRIDSGILKNKVINDTRPILLEWEFGRNSEIIIPIKFSEIKLKDAIDTIYSILPEYSLEPDETKRMLKGLDLDFEYLDDTGERVVDSLQIDRTTPLLATYALAEATNSKVTIGIKNDRLALIFKSANQTGDDNSE